VQHINSFHDQEREPLEPRRINSSHFFLSKSKSISLCEFLVMATKRPFGDNRGDYIPFGTLMSPKTAIWPFIVFVSALATWQEIGSNPSPAWQTDSPKTSKARLLVLSEKLQFPSIGHPRGTTMLEKQIDEIR
jgi:hypothetical protein